MPRTEDTVRLELLMSAEDSEKLDAVRGDMGDCSRVAALRTLIRDRYARHQRREARTAREENDPR